jgi:hypothetical protein
MEGAIPYPMFASLMLVGLVAGILLATQLGQVRVQRRLGARDFTLVKHEFEFALGRVMPVLVIAGRWHRGQAVRTPLAVPAFAAIALASVLLGSGG